MKDYRVYLSFQRSFTHVKYFMKFPEFYEQSTISKVVRTLNILLNDDDWDNRYHEEVWIGLSHDKATNVNK